MDHNGHTSRLRSPIGLLAIACAFTVAVLAWLSWRIFDSNRLVDLAAERNGRIADLRGRMQHLDEVLTMSARLAAATGDLQWETRYRYYEPQLNGTIKEALVTGGMRGSHLSHHAAMMETANAALVELENEAFKLVHAGQLDDAQAILSSDEYEEQKRTYAQGMAELDSHLKQIGGTEATARDRSTISLTAAVSLALLVTAVGWMVILCMLRKWQARLVESNRHLVEQGRDLAERTDELRKLSVATEQSPATVVITDTKGTIEYVNPRFTETTGYTKEEAIGQNPRILKSDRWPPEAYTELWTTILAGKTWRGEFENRKKNGEFYWESALIAPVRNPQGEITHFLAVKEDITERKRSEEELRQAKSDAESADLAKSEFLANMSHEIRTPMTAILGFAENIAENVTKPDNVEAIATIRRNGEYLLDLINDILDLSKVEAGKMTVERIRCKPCEIIAEVASLLRIRADAKGLAFNIEYVGAIPETIQSDPTRLRQILANLIGNSIKFTGNGAVRLITRFVDSPKDSQTESPNEAYMQFDVLDTGLGMSDRQAAALFKPFTQADTSTTREFGGTGLGLTISKRFAELLGGNITLIESNVGVGTRFRATVTTGPIEGVRMLEDPMSATVVADTSNGVELAVSSDLRSLRILLAEDGPDNQRLISFVLKKAGADVTVQRNGKLAVDAALTARGTGSAFDVILMDMQMPVMDGYEATRQLRKRGYSGPIIALTAHAMANDREKCIKAGCDDYATKPIDRTKLIETIRRHLECADTTSPMAK